ncbi:MAG: gamma-glutamyltransferase family protein [Rhodospirillaceae bacterium]|nr:MAG: gamma-glutamyltransferase family protein [Rhodospirillaceae bacterium]
MVHELETPPGTQPTGRKSYRPPIVGRDVAASTGHPLATLAAMRVLDSGGNAVDAGVAAGMALGVLQPDIVGFTGVAPIILYLAKEKKVISISGLGRWPKRTDADYFRRETNGELPLGVLRTVVPASIDAWVTALAKYGTKTFAETAQAAYDLAARGFPAHALLCQTISDEPQEFSHWPANAKVFMPEGRPPMVGEIFRQPDLARTISRLIGAEKAAGGSRIAGLEAVRHCFYEGEIAQDILSFYEREGGWLSAEDMRDFHVGIEDAQTTTFGAYQVYSCGAWCQGPVLLEFLNMLENDDLRRLGCNSPDYIHLVTEVMKLGFADREAYFGDPDFIDVPLDVLLSKSYAQERRGAVSMDRAFPDMPPAGHIARLSPHGGKTKERRSEDRARDTTYCCVIDKDGNGFSATPSDGYSTTPVIPGLGFSASDRGTQSRVEANHPSTIGPWRRPRLTPNPALALKNGKLAMVFGTPGGDVQCQAMLQFFLNVTTFGMDAQQAIETPRFFTSSFPSSFYPHHSEPGMLRLEHALRHTADALSSRGHRIGIWPSLHWRAGGVCGITVEEATNYRSAGADPRRECYAMAW